MILPMLRLYNESALIQIKKKTTWHPIMFQLRFNVSLPDITKVWNMKKTSVNIPTAYMYYQPTPSHLNLINMKGSKSPQIHIIIHVYVPKRHSA